MTEIPEHLLKRSRERRSAIGQGDDAATGESAASTMPATTSSTVPATTTAVPATTGPAARVPAAAPTAAPAPALEPVYVQAARRRKKIPFWAMATLSLMPIWGFIYVRAMTQPPTVVEGPLGAGAVVYGGCASCHGAAGGGGVGYQFSGGEVLKTFPHIEDQIRWVIYGTEGYNAAGIEIYGNPDREGGAHMAGGLGVMPQFGTQLTQDEIIAVICHERYDLGGADPTSTQYAAEYDAWCAPDAPVYTAVQGGTLDLKSPDATAVGTITIMPVGPAPVAGSPATAPAG